MRKILPYDDFLVKLDESFPRAYQDPIYSSDVFRIRYRQLRDLSNKKGSDLAKKPVNDFLDGFQVGDAIRGKSIEDGSYYTGNIITIKKDEKGENVAVEIENAGQKKNLAPATVTFVDGGDRGNTKGFVTKEPNQSELDLTQGVLIPTTYESVTSKT